MIWGRIQLSKYHSVVLRLDFCFILIWVLSSLFWSLLKVPSSLSYRWCPLYKYLLAHIHKHLHTHANVWGTRTQKGISWTCTWPYTQGSAKTRKTIVKPVWVKPAALYLYTALQVKVNTRKGEVEVVTWFGYSSHLPWNVLPVKSWYDHSALNIIFFREWFRARDQMHVALIPKMPHFLCLGDLLVSQPFKTF